MKKRPKKPRSGPAYICLSILLNFALFALILVTFAYFHHVRPVEEQGLGLVSTRAPAPAPITTARAAYTAAPTEAAHIAATPAEATPIEAALIMATPSEATPAEATPAEATPEEAEQARVGDFTHLYPGMFTDGEVKIENVDGIARYTSANVSITGTTGRVCDSTYYVADIYIRDIEHLKCGFSDGKYGRGQRQLPEGIARDSKAILAINGDYYSVRTEGTVLRNGVLYRDSPFRDICVLYWDGTMKTYARDEMTARQALEDGAYQIWSFGPKLLDEDGQPAESFLTDVPDDNPRTAIGYYAPGHYCFVVVEGRSKDSDGITIKELAAFMSALNCKSAYNLDGGQTSCMVYGGKVLNKRYGGGRQCSDIVMIVE